MRELKDLRKEVKKNFIGSQWFYNMNQKFFIVALTAQLFEAMSFNSCSDIPSLFFILVMFAFYLQRK